MQSDVSTKASFVASADMGASLINTALGDLTQQYTYTTESGVQEIESGTVVRNSADGNNYMFVGDMTDLVGQILEPTLTSVALSVGTWVRALYSEQHNSNQGSRSLSSGDIIKIDDSTQFVQYIGPDATVDLATADFSDNKLWIK